MQALSALTPPLLVCAVVVIAIVAFLRHEMRRPRTDDRSGSDDVGAVPAVPTSADPHNKLTDPSRSSADDSGQASRR